MARHTNVNKDFRLYVTHLSRLLESIDLHPARSPDWKKRVAGLIRELIRELLVDATNAMEKSHD